MVSSEENIADNISISDLKNTAFVDIKTKKLSSICIQLFRIILDKAIEALIEEKSPEKKVKLSDYYNAFDKETHEFNEEKFKSILTLVFNKNKTFRGKNPVVKFFVYRGQKPTKTDFFYLLQEHLCNQQAYRATSNLFLQTATREFVIDVRNILREQKAENREATALALENKDRRIFSEDAQKNAIQLYQYFKSKLDTIDYEQEEAVISRLFEKYSVQESLNDIKNSSEDLILEFTLYQEQRPVLDYFIMLLIAYLNKNTLLFESTLKNFKENEQLQLFSLLLLRRMANKNISDKAVIYNMVTKLILTMSSADNEKVVEEMIKTAISLNQTMFKAGEEKGISNILSTLVNKGFTKVGVTILRENPDANNEQELELYIRHDLTIHYTVRDALVSELHNPG